ncbi:hypothetical protein ACFUNF_36110 [Streptomyces sp. NPDC057291]|uniref:MmyB family transcriptional regulator n=1 Tax=Streptomyces sp. NPDC057291 TaxID=3346087 RepID=UPI003632750C
MSPRWSAVGRCSGARRNARSPTGRTELPYKTLARPDDPDRSLVVCTPEPDTETAERIALVASRAAAAAG